MMKRGLETMLYHAQKKINLRRSINRRLKEYATTEGLLCADVFAATSTEEGFLRRKYALDKIHLNEDGCRIMAQVIFDEAVVHLLERWKQAD